MALDMEVGLGPGHIVPDEDPARYPKRGQRLPNFRSISLRLDSAPSGIFIHPAVWPQ